MKKKLLILAVAGLALASCSNDEVVQTLETSDANAISFRAFNSGMTRAADVNLPTNGFWVTALKQGQTPSSVNTYFDNVHFTGPAPYTSSPKYYWPTAYNLDFYAYSPEATGDISRTDYKTFVITANATAGSQVDFVYANTNDWGKASLQGGTDGTHAIGAVNAGITINFRHAESKVIIKLKNSNSNVKFTVDAVTIGNIYNRGTFTYASTNTGSKNDGTYLTNAEWDILRTWNGVSADNEYTSAFTQSVVDGSIYSTSTSQQAGVDMILIPQTLVNAVAYNNSGSAAVDDPFTGAYIKVKYRMQNSLNDAYIVASSSTWQEAIWPLAALQWQPGYKYTYEVDLAGGGYFPLNQDDNEDLDPILEGAEIKFVTVTVDDWADHTPNPIVVTAP